MANNYKRAGHKQTITALSDIKSGVPFSHSGKAVVPITDASTGDPVAVHCSGVWEFPTSLNLNAATIAASAVVVDYKNSTNKVVAAGSGDFELGVATDAVENGKIDVRVNDEGSPHQRR